MEKIDTNHQSVRTLSLIPCSWRAILQVMARVFGDGSRSACKVHANSLDTSANSTETHYLSNPKKILWSPCASVLNANTVHGLTNRTHLTLELALLPARNGQQKFGE
jgi:hypothetical protein